MILERFQIKAISGSVSCFIDLREISVISFGWHLNMLIYLISWDLCFPSIPCITNSFPVNEERIQRKTRKSQCTSDSLLFISYFSTIIHTHFFECGLQNLSTFCCKRRDACFPLLNNFHISKTIFISYFMLIWSFYTLLSHDMIWWVVGCSMIESWNIKDDFSQNNVPSWVKSEKYLISVLKCP